MRPSATLFIDVSSLLRLRDDNKRAAFPEINDPIAGVLNNFDIIQKIQANHLKIKILSQELVGGSQDGLCVIKKLSNDFECKFKILAIIALIRNKTLITLATADFVTYAVSSDGEITIDPEVITSERKNTCILSSQDNLLSAFEILGCRSFHCFKEAEIDDEIKAIQALPHASDDPVRVYVDADDTLLNRAATILTCTTTLNDTLINVLLNIKEHCPGAEFIILTSRVKLESELIATFPTSVAAISKALELKTGIKIIKSIFTGRIEGRVILSDPKIGAILNNERKQEKQGLSIFFDDRFHEISLAREACLKGCELENRLVALQVHREGDFKEDPKELLTWLSSVDSEIKTETVSDTEEDEKYVVNALNNLNFSIFSSPIGNVIPGEDNEGEELKTAQVPT